MREISVRSVGHYVGVTARILGIVLGVLIAVLVVLWLCYAPFYIVNQIPPPPPTVGTCPGKKIPAKAGNHYYGEAQMRGFPVTVALCVTVTRSNEKQGSSQVAH